MSAGPDFVEGEVDDITVDLSPSSRTGKVALRFITIRLKLSEDKFIDVRFVGYTGPITIVRGHRIRVTGQWVKDDLFKAKKIEDISTGEWWVAKSMAPVYLAFAGLGVFLIVFVVLLIMFFSMFREYIILLLGLPFLIVLIIIMFLLYRTQKSYKVMTM